MEELNYYLIWESFFQDGVWWEVGDSEGGVLGSVVSALGGALEECRVT